MTRDPRYDVLFEPVPIGPVVAPEPVLPGAALQRHGVPGRDRAGNDARRQGRRRLGRGVHRAGRVPLLLGHHPLHRAPAVGRPGHPGPGPDCRPHPRARRPGRGRADVQRDERAQPVQPGGATGAGPPSRRDVELRPGAGAGDDQAGHRRPAALAPGSGEACDQRRVRPGVRLRRAMRSVVSTTSCLRATTSAPTSTAAVSSNRSRLLREILEDTRGGLRREGGGRLPDHRRRAPRRRRNHACRHRGDRRVARRASRTCGTSCSGPGRTTR